LVGVLRGPVKFGAGVVVFVGVLRALRRCLLGVHVFSAVES